MPELSPGTPVVARRRRWRVQDRISYADCEALRLDPADASSRQARTLLVPFDRVETLPVSRTPTVVGAYRWKRDVMLAAATSRRFGSLAVAAQARIDILPFQLEPALAVRRHGRTRVLVADDVGLGKTVQAGLIVAELVEEQVSARVVILAPAGLRDQWRQELHARFAIPAVIADADWLASSARHLPPEVNPWVLPGTYVTSIDLVKRPEVLRSVEDATWDLAVIDEAHACARHTARRAAIHAIVSRARRVVLLTATPPDGDPRELDALRSIGEQPGDPPLAEFRRTRADMHLGGLPRRSALRGIRLSPAERRMHRLLERYTALVWNEAGTRADHRARLAAVVLRKRALSSAWSLAASLQRRLELLATPSAIDDSPSQLPLPLFDEDALEDGAPDSVMRAAGLADTVRERALLLRVARAAVRASSAESKVTFLIRFIRRCREPVIVFTEYRDTLQYLERALLAAGHTALTLHGGMGPAERSEVQRAFNETGGVLLATDAASEGVNLHHRCRAVLHFELPWTLSRLRQRTGRVDRLGQDRRVHELLLVAHHTAERMVLEPLVRRARQARRHDSRTDCLLDRLTESEIGTAIMDSHTVSEPVEPPRRDPTLDLRHEAVEESQRVTFERRVSQRFGTPGRTLPRVVITRSRPSAQRFELVAAVRLEDSEGRVLHTSMAFVALECRLRTTLGHNRDWRRLAKDLATVLSEWWRVPVLDVVRHEIDAAVEQQRVAADAAAAREAAILEVEASAARQLVQAGLFDHRAVLARDRHRAAVAVLTEDYAARARRAATPSLRTAVSVLAIR